MKNLGNSRKFNKELIYHFIKEFGETHKTYLNATNEIMLSMIISKRTRCILQLPQLLSGYIYIFFSIS